jgi:hypothetical protein
MDENQKKAAAMRYDQARPLISTGDLIAVRDSKSWLGRLIQRVTGNVYTHTGVAQWMDGQLYMASLNSGYNHLTRVSHLAEFDVFNAPIGLGRDMIDKALDAWLEKRIEYGYASFVAIGLECITGRRNLFDNWRSVVVCSGGSVMIYEMAGELQMAQNRTVPAAWLRHSRQLSPGELAGELLFKLAVREGIA